jgi:alpha-tubulin suppressor-like RCC1 family protein
VIYVSCNLVHFRERGSRNADEHHLLLRVPFIFKDFGSLRGERNNNSKTLIMMRMIPGVIVSAALAYGAPSWAVKFTAVDCIADASAAISTKGDLFVTGGSAYGRLGDGSTGFYPDPSYRKNWVKVANGVAMVSLGDQHSLLVTRSGRLFATGHNDYGQLGTNSEIDRKRWTRTLKGVATAVVDQRRSLAAKRDGTLWVTGVNEQGDFNRNGNYYGRSWVKTLDGVRAPAAGGNTAFAIMTNDELWQIRYGYGSTPSITAPTWSRVETGVSAMALSDAGYLTGISQEITALKTDGSAWAGTWNYGSSQYSFKPIAGEVARFKESPQGLLLLGQDGVLTLRKKSSAASAVINRDVADFCAGSAHALVVKKDGSLWAAGLNDRGQFGIRPGRGTSSLQEWIPVKIKAK